MIGGAALVALSGPITNLVIAFIAFGVGVFSGVINNAEAVQPTIFGLIISTAVSVNLGFFVFNMLPIPPLDGSRILYAVAPDSVRGIMQKIEQNGILLVMVIVVLFSDVIGQVMSGCIRAILRVFMNIFSV